MSLLQNSNAISSGGYDLTNSLRFRSSASASLTRTFATSTDVKKLTYSAWVKRGTLGVEGALFAQNVTAGAFNVSRISFNTSNQLYIATQNGSAQVMELATTQVFRDISAWYHIVIAIDTTQATSTNRVKVYVNGLEVTSFSTATYPSLNADPFLNTSSILHGVGAGFSGGATSVPNNFFLDGYLEEVNFVDGQALTPSSFGETDPVTGSWVAKKYTGTYGNNGFYLPFTHTETNENRFLYSEDFANAAWTKGAVTVTSNTVVAPDGTTTADTLTDNATSDQHLIVQAIATQLVGSQYTMSIYAKANTRSQIGLTMHGESAASFDLTAGTVLSSGGFSNVGIQSVGNGWYRCYVTITKTNVTPNIYYIIYKDGVNPYLGTGTGSIYIWGAQITYGPILQPYIRTTTATVTNRGTTENAFTYSQDFTNASWTKGQVTITANTTTAPDGTTTASKLVENTTSSQHGVYKTFTESNVTRTLSIYAKLADASRPYLYVEMSDFAAYATNSIFNLSNGTIHQAPITNANYTNVSSSITSVGNGWYRCTLTATKGAVNPNNIAQIALCDASGNVVYAGSGTTLGVFIWGAQFEEAINVGPYWPTVASAQSKVLRIGSDKSLGSTVFGYDSWIANNISLIPDTTYDAMTDSPTLTSATVANYPTLNPVYVSNIKAAPTLANANLTTNTAYDRFMNATMALPSSGKFYWEATVLAATSGGNQTGLGVNTNQGDNRAQYGFVSTVNDVWGVAVDMTALSITWYKNNVSQSSSSITANLEYFPFFYTDTNASPTHRWSVNFGQQPFSYTPPTGYVRLNTYNLPDSTILKGNRYMDATTYTGDGTTSRTITNTALFRPDMVWNKCRSSAENHAIEDSVRGLGSWLSPNQTIAEQSWSNVGPTTNGFIVSNVGSSPNKIWNDSGLTYVGWQWQAGQGSTSSNTSGSITSTVSVNATAGFSIVTYTGTGSAASIGHGLGVTPEFIIVKRRDTTSNWMVVSKYLSNYNWYLKLNLTDAQVGDATIGNIDPTPTIFNVGTNAIDNASGGTYVAYVFAPISGFSKFGSYIGNGSTDGPFVYLGFRPKFIMIKNASAVQNWIMYDTSRNTYNVMPNILYSNLANAEATGNAVVDALSNGFKLRNTFADHNGSGNTIIYAAFAENPFKNANAR